LWPPSRGAMKPKPLLFFQDEIFPLCRIIDFL
jgi:hypothetical protein